MLYNERMFNPLQDLLLVFNMIDVLAFDDLSLLHALDSIFMVRLGFEPAYSDIAECTYKKSPMIFRLLQAIKMGELKSSESISILTFTE